MLKEETKMASMERIKSSFDNAMCNMSRVKKLINENNVNAAQKLLGKMIPKIIGLNEQLTKQQVLRSAIFVSTTDTPESKSITTPKMVTISDRLKIMKSEVTVGLFNQVMNGFEFTGNNADNLKLTLNDPSQAKSSITYVSLVDAREFAGRLSNLTGRKFRVQTEKEWLTAKDRKYGLLGNNWTWTETRYGTRGYFLHSLDNTRRMNYEPETRLRMFSIRLVEDI
jgi:Sulfatase-modifying factor enzyme 1